MKHSNIKPIVLIIALLMISCKSTKSSTNKEALEYQKKGYSLGTIEPKDTGICGWIITDSNNINYDPINIKDEEFISFSLKKEIIYFKFLPLRMKNRCKNTSPIALVEVILVNN